jgi:flagellar motor protein MotB
MLMSDQAPAEVVEEGLPGWVMTFADLMSLLMCFFVLLLAFSELDVSKYKEMAGSMKNAFGVQRDIQVKEPPKGINIIAREFSPGRPEPTTMNVIRQMTTNDLRINLDLGKERRRPVPTPKAEQEPDREKTMKPQENASKQADQQAGQKAGQKADLEAGQKSGDLAHLMPGRQRAQTKGLSAEQRKELEQAKKLAAVRLEQRLKAEQLDSSGTQQRTADSVDEQKLEELIKTRAAAEQRRKLEQSAKLISQALGRDCYKSQGKGVVRIRTRGTQGCLSADSGAGRQNPQGFRGQNHYRRAY